MSIAHDEIAQEWHKSWIFLSSKGRQRQIDYIMTEHGLKIYDCFENNELHVKSDHRTLWTQCELEAYQKELKHYHDQSRWHPKSDSEKKAYHDILQEQLYANNPESLNAIEEIIYTVAEEIKNSSSCQAKCEHPWQNSEINLLIKQRREARDTKLRHHLSLKLKRAWRCEKRKY